MEQNNYTKLIWVVAFVAFAGVSCWATAESLHLLLSDWPPLMCWVVTIGFFIIASLGTKMIVDSLNKNIHLENRGLHLTGGIILVLIFWLICSMPTNTHTFFYRTVINDKVNTDILTTRGYLSQIWDITNNKNQAKIKVKELMDQVDILYGELATEIMNEANPGVGPKSKEILRKIAKLVGTKEIEPLSYRGTTEQDRQKLCKAYYTKIYTLAETRAANIIKNTSSPNTTTAKKMDNNLALMTKYINDKTINLNNADDINDVCDKLNKAYTIIKMDKDCVNFASETDKEIYTADNPITKVKRMISVFDVWEDFIAKEYAGYGFSFWIVISILVDIAAFVFFDLAFRKTE